MLDDTGDTRRKRQLLEHIAVWAHRFTPIVSLEPPDELLLEVRGSLRLFGGAQALIGSIAQDLRSRGIAAHCALAPTPSGSLWLARAEYLSSAGKQTPAAFSIVERAEDLTRHLAPLPLVCLRWPQERAEKLPTMGLRTVGELLRLPRAGFARRFGVDALAALDRAMGRLPEPRQAFRAPLRYEDVFAPETEIDAAQWLAAFIDSRLWRLQQFLRAHQAAATAFRIELQHRSGEATRLRVAVARPCSEVGHLRELLRERLANVRLAQPVAGVRLRSAPLLASVAACADLPLHDLLPTTPSFDDALARAVERLRARLGHEALFTPRRVEDHRPERAWRVSTDSEDRDSILKQCGSLRPVWLLREPRPLQIGGADHRPEGLQFERGPERIESGWWDGRDAVRDYFVARDEQGARLWIYRERRAPHGWYLHGLFG